MTTRLTATASGHLAMRKGKRGAVWYARCRLPDGREVRQALGRVWTGRERPPHGFLTRRMAEQQLEALLTDARRGTVAAHSQLTVTFADAAAEWLRYSEHERGVRPTTLYEYRTAVEGNLTPVFGSKRIEAISTPMIERWIATLLAEGRLSRRTISKLVTMLSAIFRRACRVYGLAANPVSGIDKPVERYTGDLETYTPEEVWALVRAASSELDAALYLAAAFTGLRMGELRALRWGDVDFGGSAIRVRASYTRAHLGAPKSNRVRTVPMVPDVAEALARLGRREAYTADRDLVFTLGGEFLDAAAVRRRFRKAQQAAGLRGLTFHQLRHTFGSLAIDQASIAQVQAWMGHSSITTTQRYLHAKNRREDAELLATAFAVSAPGQRSASLR